MGHSGFATLSTFSAQFEEHLSSSGQTSPEGFSSSTKNIWSSGKSRHRNDNRKCESYIGSCSQPRELINNLTSFRSTETLR